MKNLMKKIFAPFAIFAFALGATISIASSPKEIVVSAATYTETFENTEIGTTYSDGSFVGEGGVTFTYGHSRDEENYPIDGKGLMLRRASDSYIEFTVPNGLSELGFKYRKAFTGKDERQLEIILNGNQFATTTMFGAGSGAQTAIYTFSETGINLTGSVTIKIKNVGSTTSNRQITIDDITWSDYSGTNPSISIDVNSLNLKLNVGDQHTFSASIMNANNVELHWTSTNTSVVSINEITGVATAIAPGTSTIKVSMSVAEVEYVHETIVTVLYPEPATINSTIADIIANEEGNAKRKFVATVIINGFGTDGNSVADKYGNMVVQDSSTSETLILYGATGGDATELVWNGLTNQYDFTNGQNFLTLNLTKDLKVGDEITIEAIRNDYNDVIEANAKIISARYNTLEGISVTPIKTGYLQGDIIQPEDFSVVAHYTVAGDLVIDSSTVTIYPSKLDNYGDVIVTITYQGKTATYQVEVERLVVDITAINIEDTDFTLLSTTGSKQLNYSILPLNHTEGIVFSSSNESVATVSQTGLVTYVGEGVAIITLAGENGVISDSIIVKTRRGAIISSEVSDTLNRGLTGITGTTYGDWENKIDSSGAVFAGQSAGDKDTIQIRSKNDNSGVIVTNSPGKVKKVSFVFHADNASDRTVDIYGKNTAYSSPSELYNEATRGTLLGSVVFGGNTEIIVTGDYSYIGIRSRSGAAYLSSIEILWDSTKVATLDEVNTLHDFMSEYLHMYDYHDSLGLCFDYFADAKDAFNNLLTANERAFFLNSTVNTQYEAAKARLVTWAAFNGYALDINTGTLVQINGASDSSLLRNLGGQSSVVALVTVTLLSLTSISGYYFIKKRKEQL